jgi:hypothetical protein
MRSQQGRRWFRTAAAWAAVGLGLFLGAPAVGRASPTYTGVIPGSFSNPVLAGPFINLNGSTGFFDNISSTVCSLSYDAAINTAGLQWGVSPTTPPGSSSLAFQGASFTNGTPNRLFPLGTLTYFNGTSASNSVLLGATLSFQATDGSGHVEPVTAAVSQVDMLSTVNGGLNKNRDADWVTLSPSLAQFHVFENATATANLYGNVTGDPMLHFSITLNPNRGSNGLLVNAPEPPGLLLAAIALAVVLGLLYFRTRRARAAPG